MTDIDLGPLAHGPHADLIRAMAQMCYADDWRANSRRRSTTCWGCRHARRTRLSPVEAIRAEMAAAGRVLAAGHRFDYPYDLEEVVQRTWQAHKATITKRPT